MVLNSTMAKQQVENRAVVHLGFVYTHRIPTHPYFEAASQGPRGDGMKGWMFWVFFFLQREFLHLSVVNYVQATSKIITLLQK